MQTTNPQSEINRKISTIEVKTVSLEDEVNEELDRLGQGGRWVWTLFFIATLPNILNGFHVSSYVFFSKMPDSFWCEIPALNSTSWTHKERLHISTESQEPNSCGIINYDYALLSSMDYSDALNSTRAHDSLPTISCLSNPTDKFHYDIKGSSIVSEWDLVCENSIWRTVVQVVISLGKCIGGSMVGVMSDKFGRKRLFSTGCIMFTLASILATFSPWYWTFLLARFMLGLAAPAMFFPSLIMMTENVDARHRAWMAIAFNIAYCFAMFYLAAVALFLPNWRDLQLALTVPVVMLVAICYFYKESPRWLLSKGRIEQAYQVVFNRPVDKTRATIVASKNDVQQTVTKSKGMFFEIRGLYKTAKLRRAAIICHFGFFTATFTYYVTAINSVNLSANPVVYVSATGLVDFVGYSSSILLLTYIGRKWSCFIYYALAAASMLILLLLPQEETSTVVWIAMVGRLGTSAAYAIITLYTAELFPTEVRNSAIGVSSMFGHVGSMMAPFVVDFLGNIAWHIPTTICGVSLLLAALMILLNPETSHTKLIDHVDVGEKSTSSTLNRIAE